MRPAQVLDLQADLLARLANPTVRRTVTEHLVLDFGEDSSRSRSEAAALVSALTASLPQTFAFHVTADMTALVEHAAAGLDPTDRIDATVMPTRHGLARFEDGLSILDARGKTMLANWVMWAPVQTRLPGEAPASTTALFLWNDRRDQPDQVSQEMDAKMEMMRRGERPPGAADKPEATARMLRALDIGTAQMGRWAFIGSTILHDGQRLGNPRTPIGADKTAEVIAGGGTPTDITNIARQVHAFWLLLGQTVVGQRDADIDRATRKRAGRVGLPPRVTIIELRRHASNRSEGESLVEWSHRWITRGHWRWQHCSNKHPLAQEVASGDWRCRIWIAAHIRGPEGKPLIVSSKVYALKR